MKNKFNLFGVIALAVIFSLIAVGCPKVDDSYTDETETGTEIENPNEGGTGNTDNGPKILTGTVSITGEAKEEQTLSADTSRLEGTGTISYQWKRKDAVSDGYTDISGAASSTYKLVTADVGKFIKVTVTRNGYSGSVDSNETDLVLPLLNNKTTVTSVTLNPAAVSILIGGTKAFIATVTGENEPDQTVTWSVTGGGTGTVITADGVLTIAANEPASALTVKATSTVDTGKSGTAAVTVLRPTVTSVTVSPSTVSVNKGETQRFTATITTENDPMQTILKDVTWTVTGGISGTSITNDGTLTVAFVQTANLTVKATSTFDPGKSASADVTVTTPPLTGSVTINGIVQEEQTLTANTVNLVGDGNGTITYKWARGDSSTGSFTNISGATSSTYKLVTADLNKYIRLTVDRNGYTGDVTSEAVGPVKAKDVPIPTVTSVTVSPATTEVIKGGTQQFTATVLGTNTPAQTVTWTVTGGTGGSTRMSSNGTLTVSANETVATLTVRATSTVDSSKSGTATVTVPALSGSVSITGTTQVGQTLTANTGSLGGSGTISYQWTRGDTATGTFNNITSNGTSSTYTLVTADQGKFIKVTVTRAGNLGSVTSAAVGAITFPALSGSVSINNNTVVGQSLTATTTSLGGSGNITYQWTRGDTASATTGTNIGNGASYTLTADDVGKHIRVTVTRSENTGSAVSNAVGPITLPALTGTVTITGSIHVDSTLTASTNDLGGSGNITYQWTRGDTASGTFNNITSNGTSSTYTLVTADQGKFIKLTVTRAGHSGIITSTAVGPVTLSALSGSVTITGTMKVDQTLTANTGSLNGSGNISYQWRRGDTAAAEGTNISGATSSTYKLVAADQGKFIKLTVTRANNSGNVTSAAVGPIQPQTAGDSTKSLVSVANSFEFVTYDGRQDVMKVDGSKLGSNFSVARYSLSDYKDKEITITLSVDVRREGAAGNLNWQINNSNYPSVASVNNAATGTWYSMSGTWKGTPSDSSPVLYLSTHENNSSTTTYYIDNFTITITQTSTGGGNFNGATWTNNDLGSSTFQKTGKNGAYDVEMWNRDRQGTASMTFGTGGAFKCSWDGIYNVLFRMGRKYEGSDRKVHSEIGVFSIEYDATINLPGGNGKRNAYISVYGWVTGGTPDALIEYYIVEYFGEFNPKNSTGAVLKGTVTIDGGTYELYEVPNNGPTIEGNKAFKQYFSIRTSTRTSGTISVTEHFKAWNTAGMTSINNGKLTEVSLKVESFGNTAGNAIGTAEVKKNILKIGGTEIK